MEAPMPTLVNIYASKITVNLPEPRHFVGMSYSKTGPVEPGEPEETPYVVLEVFVPNQLVLSMNVLALATDELLHPVEAIARANEGDPVIRFHVP